jgi:hypothetical protein
MALSKTTIEGAPSMSKAATELSSVTTVGLDIAKPVFSVHALDAVGRVLATKAVMRKDPPELR